jgi:hypothetical protein
VKLNQRGFMDPLLSIIKSLTQSEKRYFRLFASAFKADSQLLHLFDAMDSQHVYDEKSLIKKTSIKKLTRVKTSLRELILKAMRNYREESDQLIEIRNSLSDIEFLFQKGLHTEAAKETKKIWKTAEKKQSYIYMLELIPVWMRVVDTPKNPDAVLALYEEIKARYRHIENQLNQRISATLLNQVNTYYMRVADYEAPEEVARISESVKMQVESLLPQVTAPGIRKSLLDTLANCQPDEESSIEVFERIRKLYGENKSLIDESPYNYFSFLNNYSLKLSGDSKYGLTAAALLAEIDKNISQYKKWFKNQPQNLFYLQQRTLTIKLFYCRTNSDWGKFADMEKEVNANIKKAETSLLAIQAAILASCHLYLGHNEEAIGWINFFYTLGEAQNPGGLVTSVRFMEVMAYYFDEQYDMSDNKATNLYKTILQSKFTDTYHKSLSTVLCRLSHWRTEKDRDRKEIENLAATFRSLKYTDSHYRTYRNFFEPEIILDRVLNRGKGHAGNQIGLKWAYT